jgi:three-Cys-motif partner protein
MPKKKENEGFAWNKWKQDAVPELEPHSEAKLRVLSDYVEDYITILCSQSFGQDKFKITLVDGFAGGGIYKSGKQGSPFILLQAVEAAEAKPNDGGRHKRIEIDCNYHFIDENKEACECLKFQFEKSHYKNRLGKNIFLHQGKFEECSPDIVRRLQKRHPKAGARVIFFLDQCGYSHVHPAVLRNISEQLGHKAEFIVNFAIQWLMDFISDNETFRKVFPTLGLEDYLSADAIQVRSIGNTLLSQKLDPPFAKRRAVVSFHPSTLNP